MKGAGLINNITENWPAKVLALVVAILLYIFQQLNGMTSVRYDISLSRDENPELVPTTALPSKVRITLSAVNNDLSATSEEDFSALVDLSVYEKPGTYAVPVKINGMENVRDFDRFNVNVTPSEITLTLDRREGKYFTVEPVIRGDVAPGYELVQRSIMPRQVYVEGPAGMIEKLKSVTTEVIDLTGTTEDISRTVKLVDLGTPLLVREHTVQFNANIRSIDQTREFSEIPIIVQNLAAKYSAELSGVTGAMKLQGNEIFMHEYTPAQDAFYIDCTHIEGAGEYQIPVTVLVPDSFTVLSYEPESVTIKIVDAVNDGGPPHETPQSAP
ncbi:MAG: hypothetical protein LBC77_06665 [Spirochaetaceae bacterium]|jgi:YbbR domain-containing protein|nr:hypothetical protein [Spirochaetaceae bacterium]